MSRKIIIITILSIVIFIPAVSFSAEPFCREVPLPTLPFLPDNFEGPCVGPAEYIIYWFYFSIYLAGLLAFFAIVASGVIRLFSMGQPSMIQRSNKIITNAGLGIILLFGSYLILNIINPSLINVSNPSIANTICDIPQDIKKDTGGRCSEFMCPNSEQCKNGGNEINNNKCVQNVCKKVVEEKQDCGENTLNICANNLFCFRNKCIKLANNKEKCVVFGRESNCANQLLCIERYRGDKTRLCTDHKEGSPCGTLYGNKCDKGLICDKSIFICVKS